MVMLVACYSCLLLLLFEGLLSFGLVWGIVAGGLFSVVV